MSVKVLVVDDDHCCSGIFKAYLDYKDDWEVATIASPQKALKLMDETEFNVVVSDMRMPEMNGMIFLSTVSEKFPKMIGVLISAQELSKDTPSYIHYQFQKGHFKMKDLVEKVTQSLSA